MNKNASKLGKLSQESKRKKMGEKGYKEYMKSLSLKRKKSGDKLVAVETGDSKI